MRWYDPEWVNEDYVPTRKADYTELRETVVNAVKDRLMADVPTPCSCPRPRLVLITSTRCATRRRRRTPGSDEPVHSFSIGIKGAPDLLAAKKVADHLGTIHHEIHFTPEEALDALPDIVYHLETFEQVRAVCADVPALPPHQVDGFKMQLSGGAPTSSSAGTSTSTRRPPRRSSTRGGQNDPTAPVGRPPREQVDDGVGIEGAPLLSGVRDHAEHGSRAEDRRNKPTRTAPDSEKYLCARRSTRPTIHCPRACSAR